jgi:hypothetical protein
MMYLMVCPAASSAGVALMAMMPLVKATALLLAYLAMGAIP